MFSRCFNVAAPENLVRLLYVLSTEKAIIIETVLYNPVLVKTRYIFTLY